MRGLTQAEREFLSVTGARADDSTVAGLVERGFLRAAGVDKRGVRFWQTTPQGRAALKLDAAARTGAP